MKHCCLCGAPDVDDMFWSRNKRGARFCDNNCKYFAVDTLFNNWPAALGDAIRRFVRDREIAANDTRGTVNEHTQGSSSYRSAPAVFYVIAAEALCRDCMLISNVVAILDDEMRMFVVKTGPDGRKALWECGPGRKTKPTWWARFTAACRDIFRDDKKDDGPGTHGTGPR